MQLFSANTTIFLKRFDIIFLPLKTWKKPPSKVAHNWPPIFFQYCQTAQIQPKSQFLFHKNSSPQFRWPSGLDVCLWFLWCVRTRLRPMRKKCHRVQKHSNRVILCKNNILIGDWQSLRIKNRWGSLRTQYWVTSVKKRKKMLNAWLM